MIVSALNSERFCSVRGQPSFYHWWTVSTEGVPRITSFDHDVPAATSERPVVNWERHRVRFPRTANAPELANVRADRSHRWIHMAIGNGRVANKIVEGTIAAIIVPMEGRQIVHVRRVHRH
jgi:hypothetical protein